MSHENYIVSNPPLPLGFMAEAELARRWTKTTRTLQRWRVKNYGPPFMVIGRTVFYLISDIAEFELTSRRGGGL